MNSSDSVTLLKDLLGQDIQPRPLLIIVMSALLALMFFYVLKRRMSEAAYAGDTGRGEVVVRETPPPPGAQREAARPASAAAPLVLEDKPLSLIPQDSVLRRHYLAHIRYMIETVTFPRPSDSVLRRHYEQLIAAELDSCVSDEACLKRLIRRFEDQARHA